MHGSWNDIQVDPPMPFQRPLELLASNRLSQLFPDIDTRPQLKEFLTATLPRHSTDAQRKLRRECRDAFEALVSREPLETFEKPTIKLFLFDVDESLGQLYMMANAAGAWALNRIAREKAIDPEVLRLAVKEIPGEYICHAPWELMVAVSRSLNDERLRPEHNQDAMRDWHDARTALNLQWFFKETIPTFQAIKEAGGMVALATSSMPASLFNRLYLWIGEENLHLIDSVAVRQTLPGCVERDLPAIDSENRFASAAEQTFTTHLLEKVIFVPEDRIKPHSDHLLLPLEMVNSRLPIGAPSILPEECLLIDDSRSAGRAAAAAGMHFAQTTKAFCADPQALEEHARYGCAKGKLGWTAATAAVPLSKPLCVIRNIAKLPTRVNYGSAVQEARPVASMTPPVSLPVFAAT